jgi:predicted dehydrogenase
MLKIGVLGAGHLGKIHIRLLKEIPEFELAGFYDPDKEVERAVVEQFGIRAFASAEELISECDAIDIVTPTLVHYELAKKAIKKSKHIFIEKPLTHTISEAKSLLHLASEANVKIQVGHVERFNPAFIAAKNFITDPMFIETHRLAQFNPRGTDVSVVLDLMIHDIDIVLSLVKANIRRISASGVAVVSSTPDIANARIEFDNGAVANLTSSRISLINMRKSRFFKRDTDITVDFLEKTVINHKMEDVNGEDNSRAENIKVENTNAIKMELEFFAKAILTNERPLVSIDDGFKAMDVADKIIDQLRLNANFAAGNTINA